jgi:hypothetical protein
VPYRGGVAATTGGGPLVWLALDGHTVRAWETGLPGNHLTQVALTPTRRRAYLLGSCGYAGGFSTIDLGTGKVRASGRPSHAICGERVAAARFSRAVIARSSGPTATILVVDPSRGGRVVRAVRVPADVVDVLSCAC